MPNGPTPRPGYQPREVGSHLVPERATPREDTAGGRRGGRTKPNTDVSPSLSGPDASQQTDMPNKQVDGLWGRVGEDGKQGGQPKVDTKTNPVPGDNIVGASKPLGAGNTTNPLK